MAEQRRAKIGDFDRDSNRDLEYGEGTFAKEHRPRTWYGLIYRNDFGRTDLEKWRRWNLVNFGLKESPAALHAALEQATKFGLPGPGMSAEEFRQFTAGGTWWVYDVTHGFRSDGRTIASSAWG